jgi:hypothetical protein
MPQLPEKQSSELFSDPAQIRHSGQIALKATDLVGLGAYHLDLLHWSQNRIYQE